MKFILCMLAVLVLVIFVSAVAALTEPPGPYDDYYDQETSGLFEED